MYITMSETFAKIDSLMKFIDWNFKRNLAYEPAKNPRYHIHCFDVTLIFPNRPFALRGHVTSFLWKWKLYDFAFEKR